VRSGLRRLRNQAQQQSGPPVPLAAARFGRGMTFDLGIGKASRESQMRAYTQSGTVFSIVSLLQQSTASAPWSLYKKAKKDGRRRYTTGDQGSDQRVEVVTHAALSLWNSPNQFHSGFEFREGANQHLELTGETIWVLNREAAGFPTSMWYVRPDRMEPIPSPDDYLVGWLYTGPSGEQIPLTLDEVICEKLPDPLDPFRGTSPVASIMANIQQQKYATDYQRNLFINGADPGGVITVDKRLTEPEFDEFVDRWREAHQGIARAGRVGVLENGATWTSSGQTNKDLEYGNLRLANRDEIREAWRMHKSMLGTVEDVNRANAQTAEEVFVSWMDIPRLERRKDTLNCKFLPMFGAAGEGVEFDYEDPSPDNREEDNGELTAKAAAAQVLVDAGYDPHDVLEVVGLPDMDVVEKATQQPALPPGWVAPAAPPPGGAPAPAPSGEDQGKQETSGESVNLLRHWGRYQAAAPPPPADRTWPGWDMDLQAVDYWAPKLAAAASGAMGKTRAKQLAGQYLEQYPDGPPDGQGKRQTSQQATAWLAAQGVTFTPAVQNLVPAIVADGFLIGAVSAAAMADGVPADTGGWQPGNTQAAQQRTEEVGVGPAAGAAVGTASQQTAAQVAGSYAALLGAVLAEGVIEGASAAVLGAAMVTALKDAANGAAIALAHISRAIGTAARAVYSQRGVAQGYWLTEADAKVCPVCMADSVASPLPIGSPYPSGDLGPPGHNNCRCALVPAGDHGMSDKLRRVLSDGYVPIEVGRRR
jgi:HK97 family phage portal protein